MKVDLSKIIEEAIREFNNENELAIADVESVRTFEINNRKISFYYIYIKPRIEFLADKEVVIAYLEYPNTIRVTWEDVEEEPTLDPLNKIKNYEMNYFASNEKELKLKLKNIFKRVVEAHKSKFELRKEELELINKIKDIVRDFPVRAVRRHFDGGLDVEIEILNDKITVECDFAFKDNSFKIYIKEIWISLNDKDTNFDDKKKAVITYLEGNNIKVDSFIYSIKINLSKHNVKESLSVLRKVVEAVILLNLFLIF